MQIFGDAWTWWEKATGKYDEGQAPKPGAVLVFKSQGKMKLGHVAVVSQIITDRYIQITHANWSPVNGRRGQVEDHVNVLDVSEKGDWSKVKVWYGPLNDLGTTIYNTYGFIYNSGQAQNAAQTAQPAAQNASLQTTAPAQAQHQQVAAVTATSADMPSDLKSALSPAGAQKTEKPVLASAKVTGSAAATLVAQLDPDAAVGASDVAKPSTSKSTTRHARGVAKSVKTLKTKATVKRKTKRSRS